MTARPRIRAVRTEHWEALETAEEVVAASTWPQYRDDRPYITRIGNGKRCCRVVWARTEVSPYTVDRTIQGHHNWGVVERRAMDALGVVPQPYGSSF